MSNISNSETQHPPSPRPELEQKADCDAGKDCPFEPWVPRIRFLLHTSNVDEDNSIMEEVNRLARAFVAAMKDEGITDPLVVARVCFELQCMGVKLFEKMVDSKEIALIKPS